MIKTQSVKGFRILIENPDTGSLRWSEPIKRARLVLHDTYKTLVVHPKQDGITIRGHFPDNFTVTEGITGLNVGQAGTAQKAIRAAITFLDARGLRVVERQIKKKKREIKKRGLDTINEALLSN